MDIRPFDLDDPAMVDGWFEMVVACWERDYPDMARPVREGAAEGMRDPGPGREVERWLALLDGRVVGVVGVYLTTLDNLHTAQMVGTVHPDFRRRGVGRALWATVLDHVRAKGRTSLRASTFEAVEGGVPRHDAGVAFLGAMGMTGRLLSIRRQLDLSTVDERVAAARLAEAWTHADGYELRVWVNHTPPDLIDGVAYLDGRISTDAPTGGLDIDPSKVDAQLVRDKEAGFARNLTTVMQAALVHTATGHVAALSCVSHDIEHDGLGLQRITIVDPDHRGHRLGTVVKLELQRYVAAVAPDLRLIDTYNADSNVHMIRINDLVGYRPVDAWRNFQNDLAELAPKEAS